MKYMTTTQAARLWGISDRRVRILCAEGKVPNAVKVGKAYQIPAGTPKPADGRVKQSKLQRYLKWDNDVIGTIDDSNAVTFTAPDYNEVVVLYTKGASAWTSEQFHDFLSERIVSRDRRDIERILFRCGLSHYDVLQIAEITHGIHPKDLLWVAHDKDAKLDEAMTDVFDSVLMAMLELGGG